MASNIENLRVAVRARPALHKCTCTCHGEDQDKGVEKKRLLEENAALKQQLALLKDKDHVIADLRNEVANLRATVEELTERPRLPQAVKCSYMKTKTRNCQIPLETTLEDAATTLAWSSQNLTNKESREGAVKERC